MNQVTAALNENENLPERGPVAGGERIISLDVLRGIAVLGILIINIQVYSMVGVAFKNPLAWGDFTGLNKIVWMFTHIFAAGKFIAIFSMLFGAGIVLITRKAEKRGKKGAGIHYSRNFWLIVIGAVHAYLLWYGDILFTYGLCALPLFFLRRFKPWKQLAIGVLLMALCSGFFITGGLSIDKWPEKGKKRAMETWQPPVEKIEEEISYVRGSWIDHVRYKMPKVMEMQTSTFIYFTGWFISGMMLIGMALFKWGVFTNERSERFYIRGFLISFPIGFITVVYGLMENFRHNFSYDYSMMLGSQYNYWGALLMSFSYVCLVMLICKKGLFGRAVNALKSVGRMALSNYLMQTILAIFIFNGSFGMGLFGTFQRWEQQVIALLMWVVLTIFSVKWMEKFSFGPVEWIWRTLTYFKKQPLKK